LCFIVLLFNFESSSSLPTVLSSACTQRGGGLPQAGISQRLGREPKDAVPHKLSDEMRPRLWQTARYTLAFFYFSYFTFQSLLPSIYLSKFALPIITNMAKKLQFYPVMVRCGENPRNAFVSVRTPVAGFLFIPKITFYVPIQLFQSRAVLSETYSYAPAPM